MEAEIAVEVAEASTNEGDSVGLGADIVHEACSAGPKAAAGMANCTRPTTIRARTPSEGAGENCSHAIGVAAADGGIVVGGLPPGDPISWDAHLLGLLADGPHPVPS